MKLFIIGNGFDFMHKFRTSYDDFRKYLIKRFQLKPKEWYYPPSEGLVHGGDYGYDDSECASFISYIIEQVEGDKWSDLESSLAKLEFSDYFENDIESEHPFHAAYNNEDFSSDITVAILKILDFFDDWVSTIRLRQDRVNMQFKNLIDSERDLFLTFNYTSTLEKLYAAKQVCHIHGKKGGKLYFGHGEIIEYDNDEHIDGVFPYGEQGYFGADLEGLHRSLRKKTEDAFWDNFEFFHRLDENEVESIYSLGFSFSPVDLFYVHKICQMMDTTNLTWYLYDYNNIDKRQEFIDLITKSGYKGKFDIFSLK